MSDLLAQLQASLGDEYALERELPANGPSRLFIARERIFNRAILIKVLSPEHTVGLDFERFSTDVEAVAAIDHPSIVPPLMLGVAAGLPYIITPYVPGVTLRERLAERPSLTLEEIVSVLRNVAESLQAAHAKQVLHFDVNPGTILLSQRAALLTDLGTVRALNSSATCLNLQSTAVLEHSLRADQVRPVEALGESAVNRTQHGVALVGAA